MGDIKQFCSSVNLALLVDGVTTGYVDYSEEEDRVMVQFKTYVLFDCSTDNAFKAGVRSFANAAGNILKAFDKGRAYATNEISAGLNKILEEV